MGKFYRYLFLVCNGGRIDGFGKNKFVTSLAPIFIGLYLTRYDFTDECCTSGAFNVIHSENKCSKCSCLVNGSLVKCLEMWNGAVSVRVISKRVKMKKIHVSPLNDLFSVLTAKGVGHLNK